MAFRRTSRNESGHWIVNASPGFKVAPPRNEDLQFGFSYGFSVSDREEFDNRLIFSLFWRLWRAGVLIPIPDRRPGSMPRTNLSLTTFQGY